MEKIAVTRRPGSSAKEPGRFLALSSQRSAFSQRKITVKDVKGTQNANGKDGRRRFAQTNADRAVHQPKKLIGSTVTQEPFSK